ncbi:MAG: cellulase family glycosylhydrolase [Gaiellales bacterium]
MSLSLNYFPIRFVLLFAIAAAMIAPLLAPSNAHAILLGMESNGELINSDRTPALQATALDKMQKQGIQVVRVNVGWNEMATGACDGQTRFQMRNHNNPCYTWVVLDSLVDLATERKIKVLVSFSRVPSWVSGSSDPHYMGQTTMQFRKIMNHFVAFHQAAGTRYNGRNGHSPIRYWTIHNEPNSTTFWAPRPNAARYAELYGKTAVALRKVHSRAQIAVGPTNPTGSNKGSIRPMTFIRQFQSNVGKYLPGSMHRKRTYINAWAHNPYPAGREPNSLVGHSQAIHMGHITSKLIKQLDRSPITRKKPIWATEFGWVTAGNYKVSTSRQAQYIAEAFDMLDATKRVTIGIQYLLTDAADGDANAWKSGTMYINGRIKPSFKMMQRMISVPAGGTSGRVKRGTVVRVWGRSNIAPKTGVLTYKINGKKCSPKGAKSQACTVKPTRKGKDNARFGTVRLTQPGTYIFRVWDEGNTDLGIKEGYGPSRTIRVK